MTDTKNPTLDKPLKPGDVGYFDILPERAGDSIHIFTNHGVIELPQGSLEPKPPVFRTKPPSGPPVG